VTIIRRTFWAEEKIKEALDWSIKNYGDEAMLRYATLILQAEQDLADDPGRHGVQSVEGGILAYHLKHSARRLQGSLKVKEPVHSLIARVLPDGSLLILGIFGLGALADRQARRALRDVRRRPGYASERAVDDEEG